MILKSFSLAGKNALVTGSRRGLGAAIALALAEAGANVGCHGREPDGDAVCAKIRSLGRKTFYLAGDVSHAATFTALVEKTVADFGAIDILVNNAGMIRRTPAAEHSIEDWNAVIAADLTSVFRLSQLAGRQMLRAENARGGKIVFIASLLSFQGGITVPSYAAAKGGVAQLAKALANEWAGRNVQVNAIAPGYIATDVTTSLQNDAVRNPAILARIPAGRWGEPEDLAGAVVYLAS